jgi:hypothetical protein
MGGIVAGKPNYKNPPALFSKEKILNFLPF